MKLSSVLGLIAINVAIFIMSLNQPNLSMDYGIIPNQVSIEPYRLITSMFLHANIMHLFFSMLVLWSVGPMLEEKLGTLKFLLLYFLGGLGGSALVTMASEPHSVTVGASGAIFALFGALLVFSPNHPELLSSSLFIVFIVGINLVFTFASSGVSWQGHIGGLITGLVLGLILSNENPKKNPNQVPVQAK